MSPGEAAVARPEHPLAGRRVVVTRPAAQAQDLVRRLRSLGAEPVLEPAIEIQPVEESGALDRALQRLGAYDWVVFTSANGVRHAWQRLEALGLDETLEDGERGRRSGLPRVAVIGPGTAAALERRGVRPDYVPREYVAEALAAGLPAGPGAAVLLLRADIARPALRELLRARGMRVEEVAAYRTVARSAGRSAREAADERCGATRSRPAGESGAGEAGVGSEGLRPGAAVGHAERIDAVTFTSASTVRGYLRAAGAAPAGAAVVCIGPITAHAARALGLRVDAVAECYTAEGLVEALVRHFREK